MISRGRWWMNGAKRTVTWLKPVSRVCGFRRLLILTVWDHPLNLINWHAIQRYIKDPYADPAQIKLEWASKEFGSDAAATRGESNRYGYRGLRVVCMNSMHSGQQITAVSRPSNILIRTCAAPYREVKRIKGMMGMDLSGRYVSAGNRCKNQSKSADTNGLLIKLR